MCIIFKRVFLKSSFSALGSFDRSGYDVVTLSLTDSTFRLEHMKASPDALSGYSLGLTALLGGSYQCPLGIPYGKGRQVFNAAEELLRTATQTTRLATVKTQAGWILLASVMSLGPAVVKHHLPRMLLLWKNAFPRSSKEAEAEKQRGDAFTWQVTLEARAGALSG